jgi:hypothetical protein
VLRLEDVDDDPGWDAAIAAAAGTRPAWLVMASPRAPERFVRLCRDRGAEQLLDLPLAVVGDGTAAAAAGTGLEPAVVGPGTGLGLAEILVERLAGTPAAVIFACGHHRRPELPDALAAAGHRVLPVVVYRMRATPVDELPPVASRPGRGGRHLAPRRGSLPPGGWRTPPALPPLGPLLRDLVAEARLDARMLVQPHFVVPGTGISEPIDAMPGIDHQSVDKLVDTVAADLDLGIRSVLLFGVPDESDKDAEGHSASVEGNVVAEAVSALKTRFGAEVLVMTDVCLCAYTDHGHCGLIVDGRVDNDALLDLAAMALSHARAGADMVAPSDMMDGRVAAIRDALDDDGLVDVAIMSYSVKYASAYYGPFREAAGTRRPFGDRKTYQMDPATAARRCARPSSTSRRAPTSSWSSRPWPTWTWSATCARPSDLPVAVLQRLRRVLHGQGRGRPRLDRRARHRARELARLPPRRRRHPHHLPRPPGPEGRLAVSRRPRSRELYARACRVMPAGVSSPVRAFRSVGGEPAVLRPRRGAAASSTPTAAPSSTTCGSWGPLILGHAHPEVVSAVSNRRVAALSFGAPCEAEVELAELVVDTVPFLEMVRFVSRAPRP